MVLFLAFSLQDKVEKYGAYVGLAAFLGLAVLSLLYFAQARELKRLRDWAGRAPERQQELEARVVAQAEEALRMPEPAAKPEPGAPTPAPAAGNGRQAGTPAPIPLGPRPAIAIAAAAARAAAAPQPVAVATQEAPAVETSAGGAAPVTTGDGPLAAPERPEQATPPPEPAPAPELEPEPEAAGNGAAGEPAIPRATPRPQARPVPAAAPLRSSATRSTSPSPSRAGERDAGPSRAARITALTLVGVVVLAAAAFGATQIFGGDKPAPAPNATVEPGGTPSDATPAPGGGQSAAAARPDTVVAILNGTPIEGLAKKLRDKLLAKNYSDQQGMIRTGNNVDQQRQDSVVLYADGKRRQARDVATILGIGTVEQMDPETQALADSADSTGSGRPVDVGVVAGADQSP